MDLRLRAVPIISLCCAPWGCGAARPEIARDLPSNYAEGQRVFDARLNQRFPVGTDEDELVAELQRQGFEIRSYGDEKFGHFSDRSIPVANIWNVVWETKGGKVAHISGIYGGRGP